MTNLKGQCVWGNVTYQLPDTDCCLGPNDTLSFSLTVAPSTTCTVTYWMWDFGDYSYVITPYLTTQVQHSYNYPGGYLVSVFPLDTDYVAINAGPTNTIYTQVGIQDSLDCAHSCGIVSFKYHNSSCPLSYTIFSMYENINICDYDSVKYLWNFGDLSSGSNNTSSLREPEHIFSHDGNFYVSVTMIVYSGSESCKVESSMMVNSSSGLLAFYSKPEIIVKTSPAIGNTPVSFIYSGGIWLNNFDIDFGDGSAIENWYVVSPISHVYPVVESIAFYNVTVSTPPTIGECPISFNVTVVIYPPESPLPCKDCIGSFNPEPGKKYLLSAWVREDGAIPTRTNYTNPSVYLNFKNDVGIPTNLSNMYAKGEIIDGWQRIEEEFTVPFDAVSMSIKLVCAANDCLFDDIRVFPYDGTMKSYVYDPITLRLMAELDERNYSTLYEYDEEGKLIRVKKETERGIMTIQENRNNTSKAISK